MKGRGVDAQRGAALFVVLLLAALLSSLAGAAMRNGLSGARAAAVFVERMKADELGQAAADIVGDYVATGGTKRKRGGSLAVRLGNDEIRIDYLSESARIDVNSAPVGLISGLLAAAGAEPGQVAAVASRITALRSASGGGNPAGNAATSTGPASLDFGTQSAPASGAPAAGSPAPASPAAASTSPRIQQVVEVARLWGLPASLAERVLPALTVASRSAQVDPVLADRLVLSALLGSDEARVDDYIERREQGFVNTDSALALIPPGTRAYVGLTDAVAVRGIALVTVDGRFHRRYEFVLEPASAPGQAPKILSWRPMI